jgi:hypothetical protein
MNRFSLTVLAAALSAGFANAATPPEHLRGTLQSVAATYVTLQTTGGATQVALTSDTSYALATKSSLNAILPGSYIGTAAAGTGPDMTALEVVIFPPAMRGAGEGHYPWDKLPDVSKPGASASSMTNGSVSAIAIPRKTDSSMTNGSVQTVSTLPGAKQISVVYHGGKQIILVLPTTPVVSISSASAAALKPGVHVFIFATGSNGKTTALHIIAGANGITPPM